MEITEHERVLLVNSLIQTISELYEHDGDKDRPALAALLTRMTAACQGFSWSPSGAWKITSGTSSASSAWLRRTPTTAGCWPVFRYLEP